MYRGDYFEWIQLVQRQGGCLQRTMFVINNSIKYTNTLDIIDGYIKSGMVVTFNQRVNIFVL